MKRVVPGSDELLFLPLGGCNEIGMNLNLYGHAGGWLMVDCGISFGDGRSGVDVVMPDIGFLDEHKDLLVGLVLTHAHEDHLGAVAYLWERFGCAVYATPFTMEVLRRKLAEVDLLDIVPLREVGMSDSFSIGGFDIELLTLTHSIPEPNALVIGTSVGVVMHSGDWKFDDVPVIGSVSDEAALVRCGERGVLAMLCDSTNIFCSGSSESEGVVAKNLALLVDSLRGRVLVTCFASNIARLHSVFCAAADSGRKVLLAGRSMHRMVEYAQSTGYLSEDLKFYDAETCDDFSDDEVLVLCTGSQGEPLAALSRIARGEHPYIKPTKGDNVIFSARSIPGNEVSIAYTQNLLVSKGVRVICDGDGDYGALHASGHPHQDELVEMYQLIKPHIAIPVHGEQRHLQAHVELAEACQVPHRYVAQNGMLVSLSESGVEVILQVPVETHCLDGNVIVPLSDRSLSERRKLASEGIIFCSLVSKGGKLLDIPEVTVRGVVVDEQDLVDFATLAEKTFVRSYKKRGDSWDFICESVRIALRRRVRKFYNKNALVEVHLSAF